MLLTKCQHYGNFIRSTRTMEDNMQDRKVVIAELTTIESLYNAMVRRMTHHASEEFLACLRELNERIQLLRKQLASVSTE